MCGRNKCTSEGERVRVYKPLHLSPSRAGCELYRSHDAAAYNNKCIVESREEGWVCVCVCVKVNHDRFTMNVSSHSLLPTSALHLSTKRPPG